MKAQSKQVSVLGVLLAAGKSERFGINKLWQPIAGASAVVRSLALLDASGYISEIVLAVPSSEIGSVRLEGAIGSVSKPLKVVEGGKTRQESLWRSLQAVKPEKFDYVAVMDAARPLISPTEFDTVVERAVLSAVDCAFAAIPVHDSVHRVGQDHKVVETLVRQGVVRAATPQVVRSERLVRALDSAQRQGVVFADEVALLEWFGGECLAVYVSEFARKLTVPEDLEILRRLAGISIAGIRVGEGFDVHRIVSADAPQARRLKVLGVIPQEELYVEAHSDGDVAAHAVIDALLGAVALGDIGSLFPDTDERFRNADSMEMLTQVVSLLNTKGVRPIAVDLTVVAQQPKISPIREQCRTNLAQALGLTQSEVSVKATTTEALGTVANNKGIAAFAIALVGNLKT